MHVYLYIVGICLVHILSHIESNECSGLSWDMVKVKYTALERSVISHVLNGSIWIWNLGVESGAAGLVDTTWTNENLLRHLLTNYCIYMQKIRVLCCCSCIVGSLERMVLKKKSNTTFCHFIVPGSLPTLSPFPFSPPLSSDAPGRDLGALYRADGWIRRRLSSPVIC